MIHTLVIFAVLLAMTVFSDSIPEFMFRESLPMTSSRGVAVHIHGRHMSCPPFAVSGEDMYIAHDRGVRKWDKKGKIVADWSAEGFVHDLGFMGDRLFVLVAGKNEDRVEFLDKDFESLGALVLTGYDMYLPDTAMPHGVRMLPMMNGYWGRWDRYHARMLYDSTGAMVRGIFTLLYGGTAMRGELVHILDKAPAASDVPWEIVDNEVTGFLPVGLFRVTSTDIELQFDPWQVTEKGIGSMGFTGLFAQMGMDFPERGFAFAGVDDAGRWYFTFGLSAYRLDPGTAQLEYVQAEALLGMLPRMWQACQPFSDNLRIDGQGNLYYILASQQTGEVQLVMIDQSNFKPF